MSIFIIAGVKNLSIYTRLYDFYSFTGTQNVNHNSIKNTDTERFFLRFLNRISSII